MKNKTVSVIVLASIFFAFVLLTPTVNAHMIRKAKHYYARVEMEIPQDSYLASVEGYFTPEPAGVVNNLTAYHIGVTFPTSGEFIGGGYTTEVGVGTVAYIEWTVDGQHTEILGQDVRFGEEYFVWVWRNWPSDGGSPEPIPGWGVAVYDNQWNTLLEEIGIPLPLDDPQMQGVAGGESLDQKNRLEASFRGLKWTTFNPDDTGYWDGTRFQCSTYHDYPYSVDIHDCYHHFSISGGFGKTLIIYSTPHGTTDPSPGVYGFTYGSTLTVTASAYSHYIFRFWGFDGAIVYDNPIDVAMTSDHTLDALFIFVNHRPEIPLTPSGPTSGGIGGTYFYSTNTTDLDDDDVLYQFDWGDGTNTTTGFYASGITVNASHSWSDLGTYCVRVRAQDSYGRWSNDWSSSLEVTISTGGGGGPYRHILN